MSRTPEDPTPVEDQYLEHRAHLRAQALRLTGSEAEAEDLVHDTWVRYLRAPPAQDRPLRSWLVRVLRNRFLEVVRSERRRQRRYRRLDLRAPAPSAADRSSEQEIARTLKGAIDSLGQPYRDAIRLHYVEGLSASETADRLGIPLETARSQIKRGVALLRVKLESRRHGRLEKWMAGFIGVFYREGEPRALNLGVAVAAVASAAAGVLLLLDGDSGEGSSVPGGSTAVASAERADLSTPESFPSERSVLEPSVATVPLEVSLIFEHSGDPVAGATVTAVDGDRTLATEISKSDGRLALRVPTERALALEIDATEHSEAHRVELPSVSAEAPDTAHVVELSGVCTVVGRVEVSGGLPAANSLVEVFLGPYPHFLEEDRPAVVASTRTDAQGVFRLSRVPVGAGLLATNEERTQFGLWGPPRGVRMENQWDSGLKRSREEYLDRVETPTIRLRLVSDLTVVVLDPGGQPVAGADVRVQGSEYTLRRQVTAEGGRAAFALLGDRAELVLTVRAEGFADSIHGPFLLRADMPDFIVPLETGREIEGRVVDLADQPLPGARVRGFQLYSSPSPSLAETLDVVPLGLEHIGASALSDAEGRFRLRRLGSGTYSIRAESSGRSIGGVLARGGDEGLILREGSAGALLRFVGSVRDARTGAPVRGALVCVERRRGVLDERVDQEAMRLEGSEFSLAGSEPGDWLLHVAAEGYAPYSSAPETFEPGIHRLEPRLHPARDLTLLVEDARGRPVENAWVRATRRMEEVPRRDPGVDFTETVSRTDAEGRVVLRALPTAEFLLRVSPAYSMRDFTFPIPAGPSSAEPMRLRVDADSSTPRRVQPWSVRDGVTGETVSSEALDPIELWVYDAEGLQVLNVLWIKPSPEQKLLNRLRSRVPVERDGEVVMVETSFPDIWWWFGPGPLFFEDGQPILPHLRLPSGSFRMRLEASVYEPLEQWITIPEQGQPIVPLELTLRPRGE